MKSYGLDRVTYCGETSGFSSASRWRENRYETVGRFQDARSLDSMAEVEAEDETPADGNGVTGITALSIRSGLSMESLEVISDSARDFLAERRVAHLATADRTAIPHVVPVCFAVLGDTLYITIDEKPKRKPGSMLKRLTNIAENPAVALVIDRYDEDWSRLGWVMLHGRADILNRGTEHDEAQRLLRSRYPQLEAMSIAEQPVIAVRVQRETMWGNRSPGGRIE